MCSITHHWLTSVTTSPGAARRISAAAIAQRFGDAPWAASLTYDTMLVASELVTNALEAGCRNLELVVTVHRSRVRVSVVDDAPGQPRLLAGDATDPRGRGLVLIAALAGDWGIELVSTGKQVWAELPVPVDQIGHAALSWCYESPLATHAAV